jgi:hypothetical protein
MKIGSRVKDTVTGSVWVIAQLNRLTNRITLESVKGLAHRSITFSELGDRYQRDYS